MNYLSLRYYLVIFISILFLSVNGCGGGGAGDDDDDDDSVSNPLAVTFPDDLAVTSPTASGSSSSESLSLIKFQEVAPPTFTDMRDDIGDLLDPADASALTFDVDFTASAVNPSCFGPTLYLRAGGNHPDGGVIAAEQMLPPGDLGIWTEVASDDEACAAAQMNFLLGEIQNYLDVGIKGTAVTIGAAGLEDVTLPEAGAAATDLTDVVTDLEIPITISAASLSREADDTDEGYPVFVTAIDGTIDMGADVTGTVDIDLRHIPEVTDLTAASVSDDTYCGRLTQTFSMAQDEMNCAPVEGTTECMSVSYCKTSDTELTYHMRRAQFCGEDVTACFDDNGDVDATARFDEGTNPDGWGGNFYFTTATINPSDGSGSVSQAWQAGRSDGNTRVLNVTVSSDGTGCGYFGYGPPVENYLTVAAGDTQVGEIEGMICNWAGPGAGDWGSKTVTAAAQRQCFTLNTTSGVYESNNTNLAISYAPTNSCNKTAASFAYGLEAVPGADEVATTTAVTNNLIPIADVDFTLPTRPTVE